MINNQTPLSDQQSIKGYIQTGTSANKRTNKMELPLTVNVYVSKLFYNILWFLSHWNNQFKLLSILIFMMMYHMLRLNWCYTLRLHIFQRKLMISSISTIFKSYAGYFDWMILVNIHLINWCLHTNKATTHKVLEPSICLLLVWRIRGNPSVINMTEFYTNQR